MTVITDFVSSDRHRGINMTVELVDRFETSDGSLFTSERKAQEYDRDCNLNALDKVLKKWSKAEPLSNYPNICMTLVPFILEHAAEIRAILDKVDEAVDPRF